MTKTEKRRIFGLDLDYGLGEDSADFYEDGTMLPADRERILEEYTYPETGRDYSHVSYLETMAREEIAAILKAEADYRPPTEEEHKAARIAQQKRESEEHYRMMKDNQAWDNDSDDPSRPSIHWRSLDLYD